nr:hypothetical protein BgiMline_014520 [Biomphalaria glabrata]
MNYMKTILGWRKPHRDFNGEQKSNGVCSKDMMPEQIENKELQQRWPVFILLHDQRNVHAADIEQVSDCFQISVLSSANDLLLHNK